MRDMSRNASSASSGTPAVDRIRNKKKKKRTYYNKKNKDIVIAVVEDSRQKNNIVEKKKKKQPAAFKNAPTEEELEKIAEKEELLTAKRAKRGAFAAKIIKTVVLVSCV